MADEKSVGSGTAIPIGAGKVYVFNVTNISIQVLLNGTFLANLNPAAAAAGNYQPTATPVARVQASTTPTAQFADNNTMQIGSTQNYNFKVSLPPSGSNPPVYQYASDVLMFISNSNITICSPDGTNYQTLNPSS